MSHIVIDARELRQTTGRYVERLLHYLQQIDHQHRYSVLLAPKDYDGWNPTNPNFSKVVCPYKEFTFDEQLGLLRQIRALKPDLVHFAIVQQPILYTGRKVTTMHDLTTLRFDNPSKNILVFRVKQWVYWVVNYLAAHTSRFVITPSQFVKEDVARLAHINPDKIIVTNEAADKIADAAEPYPELAGKQFIMYVGRPMPHKNLWRLIEATKQLQQSRPELMLVLVGKKDKNYEQIANKVHSEQIANTVFTDFVTEGQLRWLYEHTATYAFPSLSEGWGLPPLEAMCFGAPVVASNASCIPEVLGNAAHYFDPLDVDDMAAKIGEVLDSPKLAKDLAAKGLAQTKKYSWRRMAEQTLEIYNKALEN